MPDPKAREGILDFLRQLRDHNDREWFEAHRDRYEAARASFSDLVGDLIAAFGPVDDLGGVTVKECMFRINRDVRFSNDKSPYKVAMTALLGRGGRKSTGRTYYFHIEPDGKSLLAGGLYDPTPQQLRVMREALAADSGPFRKIVGSADFIRYFGTVSGESLKTAPQGYPKDHPDIELLRLKQFTAMHGLEDALVPSERLIPEALAVFKAMKPFLVYLERILG